MRLFGMCEKVPLFRVSLFLFNSQAYLLRKIFLLVTARVPGQSSFDAWGAEEAFNV